MRRGFTLMEVCVATVILSVGVLALSSVFQNFNHQRRLERDAVANYICRVSVMESLVKDPPSCDDSLDHRSPVVLDYSCGKIPVHLKLVSGVNRLALVSVPLKGDEFPSDPDKIIWRIARCR